MRLRRDDFVAVLLMVLFAVPAFSQITSERILKASEEPQNWLTYSGNYASWRFSTLDQINTSNVRRIQAQWVYQIAERGIFETTPLVVDGILYGTGPENSAFALDARTGKALWRYQRSLPAKLPTCCGRVNRGLAILGSNLYMATLDAHLIALDAKTGNVIWDVEEADYHQGYTFTVAPLLVKDKVVVGVSGGEFGVRGFIDAYDANTGKRVWRRYTVPAYGEPGVETWAGTSWKTGGAPAWITGSYDPDLNLIYWPTGNPGPDMYGGARQGDNLYSDCLLALDADTGQPKWYFQFTPHDVYDYDATEIPILLDADWKGQPRKLLIHANRNGFFYVLDRRTGEFLLGKSFVKVTWAKGIGADGRPIVERPDLPLSGRTIICPGMAGGTNWFSPSYNPHTGLVYVSTREQCDDYTAAPQPYAEGQRFVGSAGIPVRGERGWGAVRAFDPHTGEKVWEFKLYSPPWAGTLSTAGGLVFVGDIDGNLTALSAQSGKDLWHIQLGASINSAAITYAIDGKQYVAIPAGSALFAFGLPED
jgi:alcohol dehydrogenase (cytochrome c)